MEFKITEGEQTQKAAEYAVKFFETRRRERVEVGSYELQTCMTTIDRLNKLVAGEQVKDEKGETIAPDKILKDAEFSMSMLKSLETKAREEGPEYTCTIEDRPEWLTNIVREAHGDMLPDDWKYKFIEESICALAETQEPDDINLEPSIYNHELLNWLSSNLTRSSYMDEYVQECGVPDGKSFDGMSLIGGGQYQEKREVLNAVRQGLQTAFENSLEEAEAIAVESEDFDMASGKRDYLGKILGVTDMHVVQSLGKGAVIFNCADLDRVPEVGENITIHFDHGTGKVEPKVPQQQKDIGR